MWEKRTDIREREEQRFNGEKKEEADQKGGKKNEESTMDVKKENR